MPHGAPWSAYQSAARALDRLAQETIPERLRARVALLGSFTLEPFVPVLRVEAARAGLWLDTYVAPYGLYMSELLDAGSGLYQFRPHVTFLAIDGDVLWNQRWAESPPLKSEPVVGGLLTPLFAGLDVFDRAGSGIVVMNDFVLPRRSTEGVNAFRSKGTFAHTSRTRTSISGCGSRSGITPSCSLSRTSSRRWAGPRPSTGGPTIAGT